MTKAKGNGKVVAKKPRGRPLLYTPERAEKILKLLSEGEHLAGICRDHDIGVNASTVRGWVVDDVQGFAALYARAREMGLDARAEELDRIADDGTNDWMERNDPDNPGYTLNGEHVQRSKLRVDTRKWLLSKLAPKKYGERLDLNHGGSVSLTDKSNDELRAELQAITALLNGGSGKTTS